MLILILLGCALGLHVEKHKIFYEKMEDGTYSVAVSK